MQKKAKAKTAEKKAGDRFTLGDFFQEQLVEVINGCSLNLPFYLRRDAARDDPTALGTPPLGNPATFEDLNRRARAAKIAIAAVAAAEPLDREALFRLTTGYCGRSRHSGWPSKVAGKATMAPIVTTLVDESAKDDKKSKKSKKKKMEKKDSKDGKRESVDDTPEDDTLPRHRVPQIGQPHISAAFEERRPTGGVNLNLACWNPQCTKTTVEELLQVRACPRCKIASYCCDACAMNHWKQSHFEVCSMMQRPPTFLRFHRLPDLWEHMPPMQHLPLELFGQEEEVWRWMGTTPTTTVIF